MRNPNSAWPLDDLEHLADALREQGATDEEIQELSASLMRLADWQAPIPTTEETQRLVDTLQTPVPVLSPVRQALRARRPGGSDEFIQMLRLVRTQVSVLQPSFWLVSALVVLLGFILVWSGSNLNLAFLLQVIGPLLSYIGTASAFRGTGLHMLEFELACPPSPRQLTLARLIIVLCYDIALGMLLNLLLRMVGESSFWLMTLHWLAPLVLVCGLSLFLSLRIPVSQAAGISYVGWLAALGFSLISQNGLQGGASPFSGAAELGACLAGLVLIGIVLWRIPRVTGRLLPRP